MDNPLGVANNPTDDVSNGEPFYLEFTISIFSRHTVPTGCFFIFQDGVDFSETIHQKMLIFWLQIEDKM